MRIGQVIAAGLMLGACASVPSETARLQVCAECVAATMKQLAAPEMNGRACGTHDEHKAAGMLAEIFEKAGLKGAAANGGFLQEVKFTPRGAAPETPQSTTYNVVGRIKGSAPDADAQAILLTAHYDHVGVRNGVTFPGANDDASGSAAVVELARILGKGKTPKRTVLFALFGCEEAGGHGARYFVGNPPVPLTSIAANLEFEMIGLPDPQRPKTLMLTGWERSNLGPALQQRGAEIGPDLYPEQNFFRRSDNYQLALSGVVAQTISAWPLPPTYHQPTDTIENLDLAFMADVVQSLAEPIDWLVNSDFRPEWLPGMKPAPQPPRPPVPAAAAQP
ncbi:MAG TPA: M28 family peptidase [Hyphomonadaceae bacterium]|nr:M28 family peptidase [Hyphomonadaceae bacterium]